MILRADARAIPLRDESVDSIVTDPPYELGFMGKQWDSSGVAYSVDVWREALRVLKPGGHLLAFGGSRTYHRLACAIEDAGFEIRDQIQWIYGSGFPKSLDVSKAIDKAAGARRTERTGTSPYEGRRPNAWGGKNNGDMTYGDYSAQPEMPIFAPATDSARQWSGWGTALKPAHEPIVMARKPLGESTVAANVLAHGTGAINVDGCRIGTGEDTRRNAIGGDNGLHGTSTFKIRERRADEKEQPLGRWPANVVTDGSEEVVRLFPNVKAGVAVRHRSGGKNCHSETDKPPMADMGYGDSGSAARFFKECKFTEEELCERANAAGRNSSPSRKQGDSAPSDVQTSEHQGDAPPQEGPQVTRDFIGNCSECSLYLNHASSAGNLENTGTIPTIKSPLKSSGCANPATTAFTDGTERIERKRFVYCAKASKSGRGEGNNHPTVKPTDLMRYLCRLVTPPGGIVLDPFAGSGSTLRAAFLEGFKPIGIELDAEYCRIARGRMNLLTPAMAGLML
jgi:site-specific DNA-methyltransferase (adenine-specific)